MSTPREIVVAYLSTMENSDVATSTKETRRTILRQFLGKFGDELEVKAIDLLGWINAYPTWGRGRRAKVCDLVKTVWNWAVSMGLEKENPYGKLKLPPSPTRRATTEREYLSMLQGTRYRFTLFLRMLRATGMRASEVRGLEWRHIERDVIRLDKHKTRAATRKDRLIPITNEVNQILLEARRLGPVGAYVFPNHRGKQVTRDSLSHILKGLRRRLGLSKEVTFHGIRHLWATDALERGMKVHIVSRILGHASIEETIRVYLHPKDDVDGWRTEMEIVGAERLAASEELTPVRRRRKRANLGKPEITQELLLEGMVTS